MRLPDEIFDEDRPGWLSGEIICEACGYYWVTVFHAQTEGGTIECRQCHHMNPIANVKVYHHE